MLWLGLAISGAYVPGWTGASIQTSWVVLSCLLPALALWRSVTLTGFHWAILSFVGISALSLAWALNFYDGVWGLWQVILFALAFWYGSSHDSLRGLFIGLGLGASASALVCFAQALGYHPLLTWGPDPSGLYYNSMYAGEIFALVILGLVIYRVYWLIPALVLALALTHSHAGMIALALGLAAWWYRSLSLIALVSLAVAVIFTYHFRASDAQRLQIWFSAATNLTLFGHGPGSFLSLWYPQGHAILFPEYTHNDFLQLAFEYGLLAIVPIGLLVALGTITEATDWPIWIAFLFMGLVSFPLYTPILGFIGACAAGRVSRSWALRRWYGSDRRHDLILRSLTSQPEPSLLRGEALPLVSRA
jgi:hypothetical protein